MKANGKLNKQLEEMMRKANRALAAARIHIKTGDYDFASSWPFFEMFFNSHSRSDPAFPKAQRPSAISLASAKRSSVAGPPRIALGSACLPQCIALGRHNSRGRSLFTPCHPAFIG